MLDRVRDRLAHSKLHLVAVVVVEAELRGGALGEVTRLLQLMYVRVERVLARLEALDLTIGVIRIRSSREREGQREAGLMGLAS